MEPKEQATETSNLEFIEHFENKRREYLRGGRLRGLGAFVAVTAGMTFIMTGIGNIIENSDNSTDEIQAQDVYAWENNVEESQKNLLRAETQIDESCIVFFKKYLPESELESDEDSVVLDMINNPSKPCGDNPTEIRSDFRRLQEAKTANIDSQNSLNLMIAEHESKSESEPDDLIKESLQLGLITGVLLGLPFGGLINASFQMKSKRKIRESKEWEQLRKSKGISNEFSKKIADEEINTGDKTFARIMSRR
jgi:hypothetical protein